MTQLVCLSQLERSSSIRRSIQGCAVSIGNFDGVHLGHRALLNEVHKAATRKDSPAVAVILHPHPAAILRPHSAPLPITPPIRRAELMSDCGIDFLLVCETTIDFLNRSADDFFQYLLVDRLAVSAMVEGPNFFFGRDRGGDVQKLGQLCQQHEIVLKIVQPMLREGRMVSSSRIREAIASGEMQQTAAMLGTPYQLQGQVVHGDARGRELGFPTANLAGIQTLLPAFGVYAAQTRIEDELYRVAVHIGPNPTFGDSTLPKVEAHILDYDGDLYDQTLTLSLHDRVRDLCRFDSVAALTAQLEQDVKRVRNLLS